MESMPGGHGRSGAEKAGRRYHKWEFLKCGLHVCSVCGLRKINKRYQGSKWKVYYQRPGKQIRPLGPRKKVPACKPPVP